MSTSNKADDILAEIREGGNRGLASTLGIEMIELSPERVVATMPVDERTRQPFGILHGGASVGLAETVASVAALLNIDREKYVAMGLEINANHVRAKTEGIVTAIGTPLHRGRTTQLWEIRIVDELERLICISRCTIAVVPMEKARKG
ncbi:MAG: hotdog fold thioesterase [Gemmatimonadaceae bacterium]|nr:hotdog fold thioesterase [Gemmatimonadaceae bacterium]